MGLNTTPATFAFEESVTAAKLNAEIRDPLTAIQAAWDSYTPAWTGATTNPVLNNGTLVGRHLRIGKIVHFRISITMGTTTTYGSGAWSLSLPVAPAAILDVVAAGIILDASSGLNIPITLHGATGSTFKASRYDGTQLAHNGPILWATGDAIRFAGTYEAA